MMKRLVISDREPIGEGSFSCVYEGRLDSTQAAIKRLKYRKDGRYHIEAEMLSRLNHKNIVKFRGIFSNDECTYDIVLELACGGTLAKALYRKDLKTSWARSTIHQISSGLSYMHSEGILHLDLKPPNILFKDLNIDRVLIADFGMATAATQARRAGAQKFQAPDSPFTHKSDVFSLASIACCILIGRNPSSREETKTIVENALGRKGNGWDPSWQKILREAVSEQHSIRPTAARFRDAFEQPRIQSPSSGVPRVNPQSILPLPGHVSHIEQPPVQTSRIKPSSELIPRINPAPAQVPRVERSTVEGYCTRPPVLEGSREAFDSWLAHCTDDVIHAGRPRLKPAPAPVFRRSLPPEPVPGIKRPPVQVPCVKQPTAQERRIRTPKAEVPGGEYHFRPVHRTYGSNEARTPSNRANMPGADRLITTDAADDSKAPPRMIAMILVIGRCLRKTIFPCFGTARGKSDDQGA